MGIERLSVRGIELEVLRKGAGPPILLLHGLHTVDPEAPFLELLGRARRDHRAVASRLRPFAAAGRLRHGL